MKVRFPEPGTYVLAVSGGVDSVALLDILSKRSGLKIIVTHFNHHIRQDSDEDERLVAGLAKKYRLAFESGGEHLGPDASEEQAREARYNFLRAVMEEYDAKAIITAHHEDDMIETAILNILRGTGPRGLVAIASNPMIIRPLLKATKTDLKAYASKNNLSWREDPTNQDEKILRNYIRMNILPKMTDSQRISFLKNMDKIADLEETKEELIATLSHNLVRDKELDRSRFGLMPFEVGSSLLHDWLKKTGTSELNRPMIVRLNNFVRTGKAGASFDVDKKIKVTLDKEVAKLTTKS
ncbi:MAG TPA: tRNA lysidine(34) synthetase TilS [Candidatus Saccharimonadales bacterium]|nr:tRNA lysidine(34) synthetase TilS [Candidatus Saccharimonadales bacterium]